MTKIEHYELENPQGLHLQPPFKMHPLFKADTNVSREDTSKRLGELAFLEEVPNKSFEILLEEGGDIVLEFILIFSIDNEIEPTLHSALLPSINLVNVTLRRRFDPDNSFKIRPSTIRASAGIGTRSMMALHTLIHLKHSLPEVLALVVFLTLEASRAEVWPKFLREEVESETVKATRAVEARGGS
ncbi:hypothetical protein Tco_0521834 [Tanacetum coccineum]